MTLLRMSRKALFKHFKVITIISFFILLILALRELVHSRSVTTQVQQGPELPLSNSSSTDHLSIHIPDNKAFKQHPYSEVSNHMIHSSAKDPKHAFHAKSKPDSIQLINSSEDIPGNHLSFRRFDVIVKLVYAYYYSVYKFVPDVFLNAYKEHVRVWSNFKESCKFNVLPYWFDAAIPCKEKRSAADFILSFQKTIDSVRDDGFNSNKSRIPADKNGVILNGAHRLAAATILSKNATFEYFNTPTKHNWNYLFFEMKGLKKDISDLIMLEWMTLQLKLSQVTSKVSILALFSDNQHNDDRVRKIVSEKCSKDNGILYEKSVSLNKLGMSQLVRHMYGNQEWLPAQINVMLSLFKQKTFVVNFMFFFGRNLNEIKTCKNDIRKILNHKKFKSSAHIPDSPQESLILAQMILNPNSVQFLNYGQNGVDCLRIATELGKRSSLERIPTLPGLYIGRDDLMVDSGSVMHLFNLRNRTDVDILFLHDIDKNVLGNKGGLNIEAHAFKSNAIGTGRPWGEDHFGETVRSKWSLFYDMTNYGFCYGIKFVSLDQLIKYKRKRNEPIKDKHDISLIQDFLRHTHEKE